MSTAQNSKSTSSTSNTGQKPSTNPTSNSASTASTGKTAPKPAEPSKYRIVEDGWGGSRRNFQASYGLGMTPEDLEEGKAILEEMQRRDREG